VIACDVSPVAMFGNCSTIYSTMVRVAKCQIFYTEQNLQTEFYPKKGATILALLDNKSDSKDGFGG